MTKFSNATSTHVFLEVKCLHNSEYNTRQHINEDKIKELSNSIDKVGLLANLTVRESPKKKGMYEVILGNRRLRAINLLGDNAPISVPCMILELTDDEALDIQVIENSQREDITPLEQAEAYELMITTRRQTLNEVALRVGKPAKEVEAIHTLVKLSKNAKKALNEKVIPVEAAFKLAYFPAKEQDKLLESITQTMELDGGVKKQVFRGMGNLKHELHHRMEFVLSNADFDTKSTSLVPKAGSCIECPKRSGNTAQLFSDIMGAQRCMDTPCYLLKAVAHYNALRLARAAELKDYGDVRKVMFFPRDAHSGEAMYYLKHVKDVLNPSAYRVLNPENVKDPRFEEKMIHVIFIGNPQSWNDLPREERGAVVDNATFQKLNYVKPAATPAMQRLDENNKLANKIHKVSRNYLQERIFEKRGLTLSERPLLIAMIFNLALGDNVNLVKVLLNNKVFGWKFQGVDEKKMTTASEKMLEEKGQFKGFVDDETVSNALTKSLVQTIKNVLIQLFAVKYCQMFETGQRNLINEYTLHALGIDVKKLKKEAADEIREKSKPKKKTPKPAGKKKK